MHYAEILAKLAEHFGFEIELGFTPDVGWGGRLVRYLAGRPGDPEILVEIPREWEFPDEAADRLLENFLERLKATA